MKKQIALIGIGSGWGAPDQRTAHGAKVVVDYVKEKFPNIKCSFDYFHEDEPLPKTAIRPLIDHDLRRQRVTDVIDTISKRVQEAMAGGFLPIVIGGDHSLAMGTWAGVDAAVKHDDFSVLWFDAHMDAHTVDTSGSLAPHGMPVAALLGIGYDEWTKKKTVGQPILKPENMYQFGIRSFEQGEAALLLSHNVHIDYAYDCKKKGLGECIESVIIQLKTKNYGISIDIDAFDPEFAPGTGTTERNGLNPNDLLTFLMHAAQDDHCIAAEIMEFNPDKDVDNKTLKWISCFIETLMGNTKGE